MLQGVTLKQSMKVVDVPYRRRDYRSNGGGILNDLVVLLLSVFVIGIFLVNMALYYIKKNPIEALEVALIFIAVVWLLIVGIKRIIGYLSRGAGNWILDVIREVKGTSVTARVVKSQKIDSKTVYSADPKHVNDAIDVLIEFGMKRQDASLKVHSVVVGASLDDVDTVEKIVKRALAVR